MSSGEAVALPFADTVARPCTREAYTLAEGPVWDDELGHVLWVDIPNGTVMEGTLLGDTLTVARVHNVDRTASAVLPATGGRFVVAGTRGLHLMEADRSQTPLVDVVSGSTQSRLNDGATDPAGRLLVGTLSLDDKGGRECLHQFDLRSSQTREHQHRLLDDDLGMSNGIAWAPDGSVLYSVDTLRHVIYARSYDISTGGCGSRTEIVRIEDSFPDGLCVDAAGRLWVALWGASQVRCYTTNGIHLATVHVPAPNTTSVAFVGPDLDRLLITTARDELTASDLVAHPDSGRLFLVDVGVQGIPTHRCAVGSPSKN